MKHIKGIPQRDMLAFDKAYPVNEVLDKPLLKKPKFCQKVVIKWVENVYYDAYVLAVNGGDMANTIKQSMWGDQIKLFVLPKYKSKRCDTMIGIQYLWLTDIGIGTTKAEADKTFCKHNWFKRGKNRIQNDRFWSTCMDELRNKDGYDN